MHVKTGKTFTSTHTNMPPAVVKSSNLQNKWVQVLCEISWFLNLGSVIRSITAYCVPGTVLGASVGMWQGAQPTEFHTFLELIFSAPVWGLRPDSTSHPLEIPCAVRAGEVPGPTYVLPGEAHLLLQVQPSTLPRCKTTQKGLWEPRSASLPL